MLHPEAAFTNFGTVTWILARALEGKGPFRSPPLRLGVSKIEGEGLAAQSKDELVEDVAAQEDV
jgi:hypothetical protein